MGLVNGIEQQRNKSGTDLLERLLCGRHFKWPGPTCKKLPIHVTFSRYEMQSGFRARPVGLICFVSVVCKSCHQLVPCLAKKASAL